MRKNIRGFYLLLSSFLITLLHLPVAFAKSATGTRVTQPLPVPAVSFAKLPNATPVLKTVYDSLQLNLAGLSRQAFEYARQGLNNLIAEGKLLNDSILSIVDFSQPSNKKRLFVIDLKRYKVLFNTLVAHGRNSGREWAQYFSNQNESYKSSPGFYVTRETYDGKNGYSLKLEGLEKGINDHAYDRGIVIHGAEYVCNAYVQAQGYIGRSQGCPAVPLQVCRPLINTIRNGTCLFIYHPGYIKKSVVLD